MARPEPLPVLTADDIDRLRANAADPDDYAALRIHRVTQEGEPAGLPDEVVARARETAGMLSGRRPRPRRRRRGSGPAKRPALPPPGEMAAEPLEELMALLDVPRDAYEIGPHVVRFFVPDQDLDGYPPLPEGYGFKGGVARKALARTLRLPISTAAVRDIDVLRGPETSDRHDRELSERYMTDDMILGNAQVEAIVTPRDYFATRELTMNMLYLLDGEIQITPLGLVDTLGGVIRVTQGHMAINRGQTHPIVAFKALRFAANMRAEGREPLIDAFRINFRRRPHPFAFFFALQLSRAFESGREVAEHYLELTREWNLFGKLDLPDGITAVDAGQELKQRLSEYHLTFD